MVEVSSVGFGMFELLMHWFMAQCETATFICLHLNLFVFPRNWYLCFYRRENPLAVNVQAV